MSWLFFKWGIRRVIDPVDIRHAEAKIQQTKQKTERNEREEDDAINLFLVINNDLKSLKVAFVEKDSQVNGHKAVRSSLKNALSDVAPLHPLVDGESGHQLCEKIFDEAYRKNYFSRIQSASSQ